MIFVLFQGFNGMAQVDCEQFTAAFGFSPRPEGISSLIVLPQWRSGFFYGQEDRYDAVPWMARSGVFQGSRPVLN